MDNSPEKDPSVEGQSITPAPQTDFGVIETQYANWTATQASNWDVRMLFSEQISDSKTIHKANIVMGHQHAKAFHQALGRTLERLESVMGVPIQVEPTNPPKDDG